MEVRSWKFGVTKQQTQNNKHKTHLTSEALAQEVNKHTNTKHKTHQHNTHKTMELINSNIEDYIQEHSSPVSDILYQLERETQLKVLRPRMLSGAIQGKLLELLIRMSGAKNVLEIGTYTGYSAICMATALAQDGHIHTIDINPELESLANKYFKLSNTESKITFHIGDAIEIIPQLKIDFDFIFIDADKTNYLNYFNLLIDRLPSGAWIIADNVLWSGKVLSDASANDVETAALKIFNDAIQKDTRVENLILSVRDGLMIIRKK